jgi:hypothetical protein
MLVLVYGICLYLVAYHGIREEFGQLLMLYSICFLISLVFYFKFEEWGISFGRLLLVALGLRLLFLFSMPALSDDYFRYFFDGHLIANGINPYFFTPDIALEKLSTDREDLCGELYAGMNSKKYHTIYPPLHQGIFYLTTVGAESVMESVVRLRLILMLFDLANILLLRRLLRNYGMGAGAVVLYAFSPLVILELIGNLHFEGIVLTCLLVALISLQKMQMGRAAFSWACAIALKLVPLILAPLWAFNLEKRTLIRFVSVAVLALAIFFSPFLNFKVLGNFLESFQLFQQKFEFNASVYYLVREVAMWFVPYNPIKYVVPALGMISLGLIILISTSGREKDPRHLSRKIVWIYMVYLIFQPVVHPWYIIPVFGLGIVAREWTPIIWSGLVIFSYSAYQTSPVQEQPAFLWLQYGLLFGYMAYRFLYRGRLL